MSVLLWQSIFGRFLDKLKSFKLLQQFDPVINHMDGSRGP